MQKSFSKSRLLSFYKQLLALLKAGLPIAKALLICNAQEVICDLEKGRTLFESFERFGFPADDCNLIRLGEESGRLEESLERISAHLEKSIASKDKIKKALMYPAIVLALSFFSIIFLLVFILPTFAGIFSEFDFKLPFLTRIFLSISGQWPLILGMVILFFSLAIFSLRKEEVKIRFFLYRNSRLSRLCRILGYQLKAGVPVLAAVESAKAGIGSVIYAKFLDELKAALEQGKSFSLIISKSSLFPSSLAEIVKIGEESGSLDDVLIQSAEYYEEEAESFIKKWTTLIEPVSTLLVGGVVGLIAFSMILPLFQMMESIK